jgi:hypothetical protein
VPAAVTQLLVISRDEQPGDALCALPTICGLAERHDTIFLAMTCEKVRAIADFPPNVLDVLREEPHWRNKSMPMQMLGVGAAIGYKFWPTMMHPIHSLMAFAGLDVEPATLPQPRIKASKEHAPHYDVLLAPFARAKERSLNGHQTRRLTHALHECGLTIAIMGGENEQSTMVDFPKSTDYEFGYWGVDFPYAAALMLHAGVVVTADSFPGRLAHAAGVKNHIILDSGATPFQTQTHPGAVMVKGWRNQGGLNGEAQWNLANIVHAITEALREQSATSPKPA